MQHGLRLSLEIRLILCHDSSPSAKQVDVGRPIRTSPTGQKTRQTSLIPAQCDEFVIPTLNMSIADAAWLAKYF
ncbi:MAG: hypothetical protein WAO71_06695 [Gallionella sp.]